MEIYIVKQHWKLFLLITAICIGISSLLYTHHLVNKLASEERKKVELWAEATQLLAQSSHNTDLNFLLKVIENNNTVPVILCDDDNQIVFFRNLDSIHASKKDYLQNELIGMKHRHAPIVITLNVGKKNFIYYNDSILIKQLTIYPYIQLFVIGIFILISYFAFNSSRKAEQNKVWLGLSRETAHQLGTPTSSLMAWVELLKDKMDESEIVEELEKDVNRLNVITERFSKMGSQPILEMVDLKKVLADVILYMKNRMPGTAHLDLMVEGPVFLWINTQLFSWVIENLLKNSLDAIKNEGNIEVKVHKNHKLVSIDIIDNGIGISKRNMKRIFKPGYTTKSRGWGLGLSLSKRIIENFHNGKIFVLQSEPNVCTIFRIILPGLKN